METTITLTATRRDGRGKGPARRLRAAGKLPGIVYGPGHDALAVAVDPKEVKQILSAPLGRNTVVSLALDGSRQYAMLKSFEYHPITRDLEHADFYTVQLERPLIVEVPLLVTGKSRGITTDGGVLRQVYRKIALKCTPDKIPARLEIDITELGLNMALHARDLKLPEGVVVMLDPGQTIVAVVSPEKERVETAATPGAAAAPGAAAGAPAAGAAAPAAGGKAAAAPAAGGKAAAPAKDDKKKK